MSKNCITIEQLQFELENEKNRTTRAEELGTQLALKLDQKLYSAREDIDKYKKIAEEQTLKYQTKLTEYETSLNEVIQLNKQLENEIKQLKQLDRSTSHEKSNKNKSNKINNKINNKTNAKNN
jgi:hypothetical protein